MKSSDKLTKKQILAIPVFLNDGYRGREYSIRMIAERYQVSWQAVWYWVKKLRSRGVKIKTRQKGSKSTLDD